MSTSTLIHAERTIVSLWFKVVVIAVYLLVSLMAVPILADSNSQHEQKVNHLKAKFPHVEIYSENNTIQKIYGNAFGHGKTPEATAKNFLKDNAELLGVKFNDLKEIGSAKDKKFKRQIMKNKLTDDFKFTLLNYSQYYDNIPVFRSEIKLLIKNNRENSLVLANTSLKDLIDKKINTGSTNADPYSFIPGIGEFAAKQIDNAEFVIWAGVDATIDDPQLAVQFIATQNDPYYDRNFYVVSTNTGEILYQESTLLNFTASGNINGLATDGVASAVCETESSKPIPYVIVYTDNGDTTYTDSAGNFTLSGLTGDTVTVYTKLEGMYFQVRDSQDSNLVLSHEVVGDTTLSFTYNSSNNSENNLAQVNAYYQLNYFRDHILDYQPTYPGISHSGFDVITNTTITNYAAYDYNYTPPRIYTAPAYSNINNCAYSFIVGHEYSHHLIYEAGHTSGGAYHESMADGLATLIYNTPYAALGVYTDSCGSFIRTAINTEKYPCSSGDPHACVEMFTGGLWESKNALASTYPSSYLDTLVNLLMGSILIANTNETGISPEVTIDILTLDDDDGDLTNGTPNYEDLNYGFNNHNLGYTISIDSVIYVDSANGNDNNSGTVFYPVATIQKGIDLALNGMEVLVKPGTYNETIDFDGKQIVVQSLYGPTQTTINGNSADAVVRFENAEPNFATLKGFTIVGADTLICCRNSAPTIMNNILKGSAEFGIFMFNSSTFWEIYQIHNNVITDIDRSGIYYSSISSNSMKNNIFLNNDTALTWGGITYPGTYDNDYNIFYGNNVNKEYSITFGDSTFFVNPDLDSNFIQNYTSPCYNRGDPDSTFFDYDGSQADIGAIPRLVLTVPDDVSTIQGAIDITHDRDSIWVDDGTYYESITYKGKAITLKSINGPTSTRISSASTNVVRFSDGETSSSVLDGFFIKSGQIGVNCYNSSPTITHCIFDLLSSTLSYSGAICLWGSNMQTDGYSPATIINNTIINHPKAGIVDQSLTPPTIMNNIIYNNGNYGINLCLNTSIHPSYYPDVSYNDVYGQTTNYNNFPGGGTGSISVFPRLFNALLLFNSPCIDAGNPDTLYNDPDSSRNDMGAVPYTPGGGFEKLTQDSNLPLDFNLSQNYPNPFNPSTTISFALPQAGATKLIVYNILGQEVRTLVDRQLEAGSYSVDWDSKNNGGTTVSSGVYLYKLVSGDNVETKKMILLK